MTALLRLAISCSQTTRHLVPSLLGRRKAWQSCQHARNSVADLESSEMLNP